MKSFSSFTITGRASLFLALILNLLSVDLLSAQSTLVTATVSVTDDGTGVTISPAFMGLSFEMSLVLPNDG